jgi:hypothetical protein
MNQEEKQREIERQSVAAVMRERKTWESTHCPYCGQNMADLPESSSNVLHLTGACKRQELENLSAYKFSGQLSNGYEFSIDPRNAAATLRDIADKIEKGEFLLTNARMLSIAKGEDFPMTVLRLVIHEGTRRFRMEGEKHA